MHTAYWPKDYQKEQLGNDRVAVIGSGASSIQTVPNMQPYVKHMDVFMLTGVWFVQTANDFSAIRSIPKKNVTLFRNDPKILVAHARDIEGERHVGSILFRIRNAMRARRSCGARGAGLLKDEQLLEGFTPK